MSPADLSPAQFADLSAHLAASSLSEVLRWAWETFGQSAAIGTSFQGAGIVMLHHAVRAGLPLPIFTLDTGLLFQETLQTKERLEAFLGIEIQSISPVLSLEAQSRELGAELWKTRPDTCCQVRKVEPLREHLKSLSLWITGTRSEQADTRRGVGILERYLFDPLSERYILKLSPMVAWKKEEVWEYIREHELPYNPLHDLGFRSIGCRPCTRASGDGESERAGRWTGFDKTECGIHTFLNPAT